MSPTSRTGFERRLRTLTPDVRAAWLRGMESLRGSLPEALLIDLLADGVETLLGTALTAQTVDRAFVSLRMGMRDVLERAVADFGRTIPVTLAPRGGTDIMHPSVRDVLQDMDLQYMRYLTTDIQQTVRLLVADGMARQQSVRTIARTLRGHLPVAPGQERAIQHFRQMLETGDRTALRRALRDHRFDRTLDRLLGAGRPGLSAPQITRMTAAYRDRMIAWNAENYARTITTNALKQGHWLAWQQAALPAGMELWKQWQTVGDNKVREEHVAMAGEIQPFDALYSNQQLVPGDTDFNCRCISVYFTRALGVVE